MSREPAEEAGFAASAPNAAPAAQGVLSPTDQGQLPELTRRVLVQLLRGPYISAELHAKIWAGLLRDESIIRQRLGDLFLNLVVDNDAGVAFVRNMESAEFEFPRVVRSQRLTLIDTAMVLFLREQLLNAEATGNRVFVGRTDIFDQLNVYRNSAQTDEVGFAKRVRSSIEKMKAQSILLPTAEDDRFEISPILRLVFDADQVVAVTQEIRRLLDEVKSGDMGLGHYESSDDDDLVDDEVGV